MILTELQRLTTQHVLGYSQGSVVRRGFDLQQFAHQRVDMDAVKRLRQEVLLKVGSKGPKDGLHVHLSVVEAVITFVDIDDESLEGNKKIKTPVRPFFSFSTAEMIKSNTNQRIEPVLK